MKNLLKIALVLASFVSLFPFNAYAEENKTDKPNSNHLMLYEEGTPNIVSPHVWQKGLLSATFSHIWFNQDFPKGSNPAGLVSYTPIDNFQIDGGVTIRNGFEFEVGTKYQIFNQYKGDFLSLSPRLSYNTRGNVFAGEISADKVFFDDRLSIGLSYSFLNNASSDGIKTYYQTVGINSIVRVWGHWYLYGDLVLPIASSLITSRGFVWGAGIKDQMMGTPHNTTLYIGNSNVNTVTGRNISVSNTYPDIIKLGFEFSIIIEDITKLPKLMFFE